MQTDDPTRLIVHDLGQMPYETAYQLQLQIHQQVLEGTAPQTLLLVEHHPVITLSQRRSSAKHVLADTERLKQMGIDLRQTDRGGDVTYHGPGQLVAYPILRLGPLRLNISRYMRLLEQAVMDTVLAFGVRGYLISGCTGVWVDVVTSSNANQPFKLCAMGVRVRRHVTMHGLALNVTTDLTHFDTIVPCGLSGRGVTSLHQLLADHTPNMNQVKHQLTVSLRHQLTAASPTSSTTP